MASSVLPIKEENDDVACRSTPVRNRQALTRIRGTDPRFVLLPSRRRRVKSNQRRPLHPVTLYRICFGANVDARIEQRLANVFAEQFARITSLPPPEETSAQRKQRVDARGFIYCFHELSDPSDVLKIGRTSRTPEQRLSEWERELAPEPGKSVFLLFAYATAHNQFAERVIHETLRCENIANRINALTGDELDEFYRVNNMMALSVFVRECIRFVDTWWQTTRRLAL